MKKTAHVVLAVVGAGLLSTASAAPLGSAITYQGQLKKSGAPVNEIVDLRFQLLADEAGTDPVAGTEILHDAVNVINGLFIVDLDFGAAAFNGEARWLQVLVRAPHDPSDSGAFTPLAPNAPIAPAPYALQTRGIHVSETGEVGIGPGPFVADANLQVGIDPVANTLFGGTNLQIGDSFTAQLVLGTGAAEYLQISTSSSGTRINSIGNDGLDFRTGPTAVDAPSRLFLSPSGNVGIGTTTPTTKLEIASSGLGPTLRIPGTLDVGRFNTTGVERPWLGLGTTGPYFGNESLTVFFDATDSSAFGGMTLASNHPNAAPYYGYATGSVAAWTYLSGFDGAWRLHVGNFEPFIATPDGKIGLGGPFPNPFNTLSVFGTTDIQGNLGVGTTVPTNRLTVSGSANITSNLGIGTATPGTSLHVFRGPSGVTFPSTRSAILEDDASHFLELLAPDTVQTGILFGNPAGGSASAGIVFNNPGVENGLQFRTGTNDTRMVINNAGLVGIGTTSPQRQLHLSGGSDINTGGVGGALMIGTPLGANFLLDENEIQSMNNGTAAALSLNALGGNVGVGSTGPETLLHLFKGDAGMASNPANTLLTIEDDASHYVRLMVPDATETGILFGNPTNGGTAAGVIFDGAVPNGLQFRTGSNSTRMVIDSSGRLGLGTTAPAFKADIVASGTAMRITSGNTDLPYIDLKTGTGLDPDAGGIRFLDSADTVLWQMRADSFSEFSIRAGSTSRVRIDPDGSNSEIRSGLSVNTLSVPFNFGILNVSSPTPSRLIRFNDTADDNLGIISEIGSITYTGTTVSYNAFTGSHYGWSSGSFEEGTLMSMTGDNRRVRQDVRGEPIYGIAPTAIPNDPAALGAYAQPLGIDDRADTHLVSSVGNGDLCVVDRGGGDIEPGDYLISSDVTGCAMKDDPTKFAIGHIIAKAADRIVWSDLPSSPDGVRRTTASVLFGGFVRDSRGGAVERELQELRSKNTELTDRVNRLEQMLLQQTRSANR